MSTAIAVISLITSLLALYIAWRVMKATEAIAHTLEAIKNIEKDKK
jgi:hypothetical protein